MRVFIEPVMEEMSIPSVPSDKEQSQAILHMGVTLKTVSLWANLEWAAPQRLGVGINKGLLSFVWDYKKKVQDLDHICYDSCKFRVKI